MKIHTHITLEDIDRAGDWLIEQPEDWQDAGHTRADRLEMVDLMREILITTGAPTFQQAVEHVERWKRQRAHGAN